MKQGSEDSDSYRLVVLGSTGVGKSALISMFLKGDIERTYKPTVDDIHIGYAWQGRKKCKLEILDTSGSYDFPAMRRLYISTGHIFLLVHSLQDPKSFEDALCILEQIRDERTEQDVPILVVGTKSDQKRPGCVSSAEAELRLIDYMDVVRYVECNAKSADSVNSLFKQVANVVLNPRDRSLSLPVETDSQPQKRSLSFLRRLKSIRRS
ncbi:GTP-binding protein Di-Ras2-like [Asterias rubens]|uniref:GTP-binding protein Di-Ras2-like n=1 Tax=Asterias rubens TaxID=7604 RepID=UPI001455AC88|nr:GTP-binding protein Di-Ras2-like [Asterias rubens]XP_033637207.1 GTP-binding protein Di-Ras2-like [Asterias rubens]